MSTENQNVAPAHAEPAENQNVAPTYAEPAGNDAPAYVENIDADVRENDPRVLGREVAAEEITDPSPVLADVAPAYGEPVENAADVDAEKDEPDMSTLPAFRSFEHELPSARFVYVIRAVEIIRLLPEDMVAGDTAEADLLADDQKVDFDMLDNVTALAEVVPAMEQYVLDVARDPEAMRAWLVEQGTINAVMRAFTAAQAHAKN